MCLVAWNNQYLKLFDYPKDIVYVGCPISDLIRYNAERGECAQVQSKNTYVRKRMHWMQVGSAHEFERIRKDGRVIQMRNPIEGGGFVTTFADITAFP